MAVPVGVYRAGDCRGGCVAGQDLVAGEADGLLAKGRHVHDEFPIVRAVAAEVDEPGTIAAAVTVDIPVCRGPALRAGKIAGDGPADREVADSVAAAGVVTAGLVWLAGAEVAHPASTAAAIPPAAMRPTLDITVVLSRRDRFHYSLHAPAPRQVAEVARKRKISRTPAAPQLVPNGQGGRFVTRAPGIFGTHFHLTHA